MPLSSFPNVRRPLLLASLLALLLACVSLPAAMGNDEGMWTYIGRIWAADGTPPYVGAVENKSPAIFELCAVSYRLFGTTTTPLRLVGILALWATSLVVYRLGSLLHSRLAGMLSMTAFGLSMSWEILDGPFTTQTESFMILFSMLAALSLLGDVCRRSAGDDSAVVGDRAALASGLALGAAISFKQVALLSAAGWLVLLLLTLGPGWQISRLIRALSLTAAGVLGTIALSLVPLWLSGVGWHDYFDGTWKILLNPGSSQALLLDSQAPVQSLWVNAVGRLHSICRLSPSRLVRLAPLAAMLVSLLGLLRKRLFCIGGLARDRRLLGLAAWCFCDAVGACASGSGYGHQFKQIAPTLAVLLGVLSAAGLEEAAHWPSSRRRWAWGALCLVGLAWLPHKGLFESARSVCAPPADECLALAQWIGQHTEPDDYVWTYEQNDVLSSSGRRSPSPYFNATFAHTDAARGKLLADLAERPPSFIVTSSLAMHRAPDPALADYVAAHFEPVFRCGEYTVLGPRPAMIAGRGR